MGDEMEMETERVSDSAPTPRDAASRDDCECLASRSAQSPAPTATAAELNAARPLASVDTQLSPGAVLLDRSDRVAARRRQWGLGRCCQAGAGSIALGR